MIKRFKDFSAFSAASLIFITAGFAVITHMNKSAGIVFLVISLLIFALYVAVLNKRNREITALSDYLSRINNGEYDLDIQDNREGEMSLLKNNLYKVVVTLRSQQEMLQRDKKYLAESLADISHQLKTPITSITMMTDLLKSEPEKEKQREFIDIINSQLSRMNWLIITLLKLSKIDADSIEFRNEEVDLKALLNDAVRPFLVTAEVNQIELCVDCPENICVLIDRNWYFEAISNIIKNCIEHTGKYGFVRVSVVESALFTKMIIRDNGTGICKEDLPHIFERFYQGKTYTSSGVGIGLALSKAIFGRQNSVVSVKSDGENGTEFEIRLYKSVSRQ